MDLIIIMPVYNEKEVIGKVVEDWLKCLRDTSVDGRIWVYDDGSTDGTIDKLRDLEILYSPQLEVFRGENRGHGPTLVEAYKKVFSRARWVLQIDSDGEVRAQDFSLLWHLRSRYHFLLGERVTRKNPLIRKIFSFVAKIIANGKMGPYRFRDVNCPFRLMKSSSFIKFAQELKKDELVPNIKMVRYVLKNELRGLQVPIGFVPRKNSSGSFQNIGKLLSFGLKAFFQLCLRN